MQSLELSQPGLYTMLARKWLYLAKVVGLAAVYFGVGRLGLLLAVMLGHNTLVWPPTGTALAALLLFGAHLWPGIALGAFLAALATGVPLAVACGVSAGNTLEALCAVYLLHRVVGFRNTLERLQDVFGLVVLAAGLSTMVSATIDVASFCLGGVAPWEAYGVLWQIWWLGGAMSDLVVAPLILTWGAPPAMSKNPRQIAEAGILVTALVAVCLLVFGGWSRVSLVHSSLDYAVFPLIIWAGLRFRQREAMTAVFIVSAFATWGTAQQFGPFARGTVPERLSLLYTFISVTAMTALIIAARKRAEETLRRLSRQLARVQDDERRRIACELHETVGQNLSASAMLLSLVNKSDAVRDPRAREHLAESLTLTQQCAREIRTLSHLLHPPLLDEMGLGAALQWYIAGFGERSGIKVTLEVSPELNRVQGDIEIVLFRVVQECLLNIHRHSGSSSASISLLSTPHQMLLTVVDKGRGIPAEIMEKARTPDSPLGVGIASMHERVRQIGGKLEIQSDGQGTRVIAILPR